MIKLSGFAYKANTNLYQLKFLFTSGVESKVMNTQKDASEEGRVTSINPQKDICTVEVNLSGKGNIYGLRFLDSNNNKIAEKQWRMSSEAKWARIEIPSDMSIIGFHCKSDDYYIRQFGLVCWEPNPMATNFMEVGSEENKIGREGEDRNQVSDTMPGR